MQSQSQIQSSIYLDDTIQTIKFQKEALEVKFRHNINELARKNIQLSAMLKNFLIKEQSNINAQCQVFKKTVGACISIQDSLTSLDVLEKKTQILKMQVNQIKDKVCQPKGSGSEKSL